MKEAEAMFYQFPENFTWGVATAAAQIEGGAYEDGRGLSIWDVFAGIPGAIKNGGRPEVACDSYHLVERDVEMMKELGINSYRFSFSWSSSPSRSPRRSSRNFSNPAAGMGLEK